MLKWEIKSKMLIAQFSFEKVFTCFALAFNLNLLGPKLDIATLFLSVLAYLAS